jgi:hypothetical protein
MLIGCKCQRVMNATCKFSLNRSNQRHNLTAKDWWIWNAVNDLIMVHYNHMDNNFTWFQQAFMSCTASGWSDISQLNLLKRTYYILALNCDSSDSFDNWLLLLSTRETVLDYQVVGGDKICLLPYLFVYQLWWSARPAFFVELT